MIAITGGGTGGHLMIAKAIKEELNARGVKPIFVGSTNGQDRTWFEKDEGFSERIFLNSGGVVNKSGFAKIASLINVARNGLLCSGIIKSRGITKVLSVGGYSAAPLVFASIISRTSLYIHEQNAVVGKLNSIAKPFSKAFFSSFDNASICSSYPVPKRFFEKARVRDKIKKIIFLGGSQGATTINNMALKMAQELTWMGIEIIHQTGNRDYERVLGEYSSMGLKAEVFAFSTDLAKYIADADFAISRAGASAMFELVANGLPAFFVPYPYAAANHQESNANYLASKNMAFYSTEANLNLEEVFKILKESNINDISKKLHTVLQPNGAKCIANILCDVL